MVIVSPMDIGWESISLAKRSPSLNLGWSKIVHILYSKFKIVAELYLQNPNSRCTLDYLKSVVGNIQKIKYHFPFAAYNYF
jgi:hypothetical protein